MASLLPLRARPFVRTSFVAWIAALLLGVTHAPRAADDPPTSDCCFYQVGGKVFYDFNADGIINGGDYGLAGWTVQVLDMSDNVLSSWTTDGNGDYVIPVPAWCGTPFKLREVVQSGWSRTYPAFPGTHTASHTGCSATPIHGPYNFGNIPPECQNFSKTYTLDADFNLGTLSGVITNSDQLELAPTPTTWEFAWIANSGEGTMSKVSTITGREVARYYTGPPNINGHGYLAPSRTVVDEDGNCWVANRTFDAVLPSLTQVAITGGIDRNNNNIIDTSTDANNNGIIDPWEILPWGQDERVLRHYPVGTTVNNLARGFAIDRMGYLWIGLWTDERLVKIDPNLSTVTWAPNVSPPPVPELASVAVPGNPAYGLALSPNNFLYASTLGPRAIEIDPGLASGGTGAGPAVAQWINHGGANYGIAVDKDCIVWLASVSPPGPSYNQYGCVRWDPSQTFYNPALGWSYSLPGAPQAGGRGITVDFNGKIWMTVNSWPDTLVQFDNTNPPVVLNMYPTSLVGLIGVGTGPDGNIIVTANTPTWEKRNVLTGAYMPLVGPETAGLQPYTYSDFTGSLQFIVNQQQGTWTVITDGGSNSLLWNLCTWSPSTPPGTSVQVEARTASTIPGLNAQNWTTLGTPGPLSPMMPGRYIETRVRLQRTVECGQPFVTPILYDLTVAAICDTCEFTLCPPDTTVQCQFIEGAIVEFPQPILEESCDSTFVFVSCTPPSGSVFPIGTTAVNCIAVNSQDDTVTCSFSVTVTGDCDPPVVGACCVQDTCLVLTHEECELRGGLYQGDNTACDSNACGPDCAHPPAGLVGWWPLDGASGGVSPNLAGPTTGATLIGGPTNLAGQHVNASYSFDGLTQYASVPHNNNMNIGASDLSIDAWVRTTGANGVQPIVEKRADSPNPNQGYAFFLYDGYPALQLAVGGGFDNYITTAGNAGAGAFVADGAWHFVAVTVDRNDPTGIQFYVDGVPVGPTFNPTARQGNLNNTDPLWLAQARLPSGRFFRGALDEVEIFRRELTAGEIHDMYEANDTGKCKEACYATQLANCCNGGAAPSAVTICNYDLVPHTYSWGVTGINGGPGCAAFGPTSFSPASGTVTIPAQGCVTIPISIACPSNVPIGQASCYQVTVFNHDTGKFFDCTGSVRRPAWWCSKWKDVDLADVLAPVELYPGVARALHIAVAHIGVLSVPTAFPYQVVAVDGENGEPSPDVSLNGLPPGEPVIGNLLVDNGQTVEVPVSVQYLEGRPIGFDRLVLYGDDDMDGVFEPLASAGVRSVTPGVSGVGDPPDVGAGGGGDVRRPFLALPNPFSPSQSIRFRLEEEGRPEVTLRLFDLQGRAVKQFMYKETIPAGEYEISWDGRNDYGQRVRMGIYFLQLRVGDTVETVKIVVRPGQ